jgi:hypothetical protein
VLKQLKNPYDTSTAGQSNVITVGYTGTAFFRIEAVDSLGSVTSISILNSGALVRKKDLTTADQAKAKSLTSLTTGLLVNGTYYNINTGTYYAGVAGTGTTTTTTTATTSATTTTAAPAAITGGGGTGLGLAITLALSVPNVGPGAGGYVDEIDSYQGLFNRGLRVGTHGDSYPLKYYLSISNNGFFL